MQALFEKFTNQEKITDTIPFSFTELNEIYCKTDQFGKTFIHFMEYMIKQISENELNFDIMLFVPECYIMGANFCYNYNAEDRFQEPEEEEEEQFYQAQPNKKEKDIK
jgi:hypothetical protein